MNSPLSNSIAANMQQVVAWRHDIHQHPELQFDVQRTASLVAARLREFAFDEVIENIGHTGVIGLLHGENGPAKDSDHRVLFRADMDALPLSETSGATHTSCHEGKMHACGHDGHTAMLLGAAQILAKNRHFNGTIVFCFQPAEEGGGGAKAMIDDGVLEKFPLKGAYALHNYPGLNVGEFSVCYGPALASSDAYEITITGTGGHAAQPYNTRDPIITAAHIVTGLQTIVSRVIDPREPAVLSVTSIHGGDAFNIIPNLVTLKMTVRTFDTAIAKLIGDEIKRISEQTAASFGASVEITRPDNIVPYPPTVNHRQETDIAIDAMADVVGRDNVHTDHEPVMGAEDFSFFLQAVPGCFAFIGNGNSADLHNPAYDFNDQALPHGIAYWCTMAQKTLPSVSS